MKDPQPLSGSEETESNHIELNRALGEPELLWFGDTICKVCNYIMWPLELPFRPAPK